LSVTPITISKYDKEKT